MGSNKHKGPKVPKFGASPRPHKVPRHDSALPEHDARRVAFEFWMFDECDWRRDGSAGHISFPEVVAHLKSYESRTWKDVKEDRRRDHSIPVTDLPPTIQRRLIDRKMDDIDELWRFRFGSRQRLWGIRVEHVLRVLWWDPDHMVYPVEPRNT